MRYWLLSLVGLLLSSCAAYFSAGTMVYSQTYPIACSEESFVALVRQYKERFPERVIPAHSILQDHQQAKGWTFFFYCPEDSTIMVTRYLGGANLFSFDAVGWSLQGGSWKGVNKMRKKRRQVYLDRLEKQILPELLQGCR